MAATLQLNTIGRGPGVLSVLSAISVTIAGNGAAYATAAGGLPIDLLAILQAASAGIIPSGQAPNYTQTINVADIVGVTFIQLSTNGYIPAALGNILPTYSNVPWQYDNGPDATPGILLTCPATIRLYGSGNANGAALQEVADGANNDTFTVLLLINRGGANN